MKTRSDKLKSVAVHDLLDQATETGWEQRRDAARKLLPDAPFIAPNVASALIRVFESAMIALVAFANLVRYPGLDLATPGWLYASAISVVTVLMPILLHASGHYKLNALLNPLRQIPTIAVTWTLLFGLTATLIVVGKLGSDLSRGWFLTWATSGLLFAIAIRFGIAALLRYLNKNGQFNRRAVLVGGGEAANHVISTLQNSQDTGLSLVGTFDDRGDGRSPSGLHGLQKLGNLNDLIDFVRSTRIDTLIITLPVTAEERLLHIMNRLWVLPVDIRLSAHGQKLRYRPRAYSYIGNLALLDLFDRPLGDWGPFLKSVEDKAIASLALLLLSPVFAAVALAVKLDSKGPVFFRQKRYGFNNELIEVYKFRSMYVDKADADAKKLVTKGDPRVTKVGSFIRRTSMDELPQLLNVLKGELSLVGPRPHATKASAAGSLYETVVEGYFARHKVKPGMTGWAQVNGWRGETDTEAKIERRVEHDLYYIENWSLTFDLYILARTPFALLNTERAY